MIWKILLIISIIIAVLEYLVIRGASINKTDEEKAEEDMQQLLFLKQLKEKKKNEKTDYSGETECCKRISENLERMYKD